MALIPPSSQGGGASGVSAIFSSTLGADAASWDITGISNAYSALMILCRIRGATAGTNTGAFIRFNNDSGANYSYVDTGGVGAAGQTAANLGSVAASTATANDIGEFCAYVPGYSGTTFFKGMQCGCGYTNAGVTSLFVYRHHLWDSTAAINQVTVSLQAGNILAGSQLTVLGVG